VRQILSSLLDNAVNYTSHGEMKAQIDVVSRTDRETVLRFSVRDTGPGIPSWKKEKLFESDAASSPDGGKASGGTGLTIAARLVQLMGGELQVDSHVSKGSTNSFTIPLAVPAVSASAKALALSA
jgi:signal transduction histidine kinase